jgi:hypothetical protein
VIVVVNPISSVLILQMMKLFWTLLPIISSLIILQSAPSASENPFLSLVFEATDWIDHSQSVEKQEEGAACNAPPSLSYLRSHVKSLLVSQPDDPTETRDREEDGDIANMLGEQPLIYSFYEKHVFQPYRSRLQEANASSTSFCYLDKVVEVCKTEYDCIEHREAAVCFPKSDDANSEGTCVSCTKLKTEIEKGRLKDETNIGHLMDSCEPNRRRGPKPTPEPEKNTTEEVRWLRWLLESSYVFEKKKAGDKCDARSWTSKSRAYIDVLMKKHFGKLNVTVSGADSLTVPGMEAKEEEMAYEAARADLYGKQGSWWEKKISIRRDKGRFDDEYCSREEGLICVDIPNDYKGRCKDCGDEEVGKSEACHPDEEGYLRKEEEEEGGGEGGGQQRNKSTSTEGSGKKVNSAGSAQDGGWSSELSLVLGIVYSILFFQ